MDKIGSKYIGNIRRVDLKYANLNLKYVIRGRLMSGKTMDKWGRSARVRAEDKKNGFETRRYRYDVRATPLPKRSKHATIDTSVPVSHVGRDSREIYIFNGRAILLHVK